MLQLIRAVIIKQESISKIIHITLVGLLCCLCTGALNAQVKFYTKVSEPTVGVRQTFQVQYTVEGSNNIRQFKLPQFSNFDVVEFFDYNTSSYPQGTETHSKIFVLLATKKGRFIIPGASAIIDGKEVHSKDVSIEVKTSVPGVKYYEPADVDTEEESVLHPGESIKDKIEKNLFLRVETSKNTCYVGEPLMVTYKAYSRLNASSQIAKRPSLTGFSVMEMVDAYDAKPEIEQLNGRAYYTNLVRKVQLFPLQEGTYTLDPAEIESVVHFAKTDEPAGKKAMGGPFGNSPLFSTPVIHRTIVRSAAKTIVVKPLPTTNQPEDFSGAVGQFDVVVKVSAEAIHQGDLVKIQVTINGSGNLSLVTLPPIKWPKGIDTAEPAVKENINKYIFPLSGSKTFEYSFAAPDTGDYLVPAIRLPYYDPAEKKYRVAASDSIILHVLPGAKKAAVIDDASSLQNSGLKPQHFYFTAIVLAILATIGYQVFSLRKSKKAATKKAVTPVPVKQEIIPQKTATSLLAKAMHALEQQQPAVFYYEVQQALWQMVADNYKVLPSKMNKHHIAQLLAEKDVPAETIGNFSAILDECEWALYTPGHSVNSMETLLTRAEGLLNELLEVRS